MWKNVFLSLDCQKIMDSISKFSLDMLKKKGLIKKGSEIKDKKLEKPSSLIKVFPKGEFIETPFKKVFKVKESFSPETNLGAVKISDFFHYINNILLL